MELLDTLLRHPPGEVAVFANIMHDLGDALQGGDDPPVQRVGQQQADKRGEQNAACQYQNRDAEKVAN